MWHMFFCSALAFGLVRRWADLRFQHIECNIFWYRCSVVHLMTHRPFAIRTTFHQMCQQL